MAGPSASGNGNLGAVSVTPTRSTPWRATTLRGRRARTSYEIDSAIYEAVADGLTEADPLHHQLGAVEGRHGHRQDRRHGPRFVGDLADAGRRGRERASADDIGYMAFPATSGGTQYATVGGDYNLGINKNSSVKAAAPRVDQLPLEDSGFTESQGMVSPLLADPLPSNLADLSDNGVELIELSRPPAGEESLFASITDASSDRHLGQPVPPEAGRHRAGRRGWRQGLVLRELNLRWADAVASVG